MFDEVLKDFTHKKAFPNWQCLGVKLCLKT